MSVQDFEDVDDPLNSFTIPQLKAVLEYHKIDLGKLRKKADIVNLCKESNINIAEVPEHIATPRKAKLSKSGRRSSTTFAFTSHSSEDEVPLNQRRSTVAGDRLLAALDGENSPDQQTNSPTHVRQKVEVIAATVEVQAEPTAAGDALELAEEPVEGATSDQDEEEVQSVEEVDRDLNIVGKVFDDNDEDSDVEEETTSSEHASQQAQATRESDLAELDVPEAASAEAVELVLSSSSSSSLPLIEPAEQEAKSAIAAEETIASLESSASTSSVVQHHDRSFFARMHQLSTATFGALCAVGVLGYAGLCYYLLSNPPVWADAGYPLMGLFIVMAAVITLGRYDEWFHKTFGSEPLIVRDAENEELSTPNPAAANSATVVPPPAADDFEVLKATTLQLLTEQRTMLFQGIESLESQIRELTPRGQAPVRSSKASKQLREASRDLAGMIHTLANVQAFFSAVATAEEDPEFVTILRAFANTAEPNERGQEHS